MSKRRAPVLADADAFLHVIYEHRYFSLAARAWVTIGAPNASDGVARDQANDLISGIGVLLQDSLLTHARNLIDFYEPDRPRASDVVAEDFGLQSPSNARTLRAFKIPIDVHVSHITAWRDEKYRQAAISSLEGAKRQRPDWNLDNVRLIEQLMAAIDEAAATVGRWRVPFTSLRDACVALKDHGTDWPDHLAEVQEVDAYLASLGLP